MESQSSAKRICRTEQRSQYCFPPGPAYASDPFVREVLLSHIVSGDEDEDGEIEVGQAFFGHGRSAAA